MVGRRSVNRPAGPTGEEEPVGPVTKDVSTGWCEAGNHYICRHTYAGNHDVTYVCTCTCHTEGPAERERLEKDRGVVVHRIPKKRVTA